MEKRAKTKANNETIRNYSLLSQRETIKPNFFPVIFLFVEMSFCTCMCGFAVLCSPSHSIYVMTAEENLI